MDEVYDLFTEWLATRRSLIHEFSSDFERSTHLLLIEARSRADRLGITDIESLYPTSLADDIACWEAMGTWPLEGR